MAVIEVEHLHKRYRDRRREHVAVHDVSFTVAEGEIFGILGVNGAGKTTTVECVAGLRIPDGGRIAVLGMDPFRDRAAVRRVLGVQLQESALPDKLRVAEAAELFASFHDHPADPEELIARWGLARRRDTAYRDLSGGQKQRLAIVLALVGRPRLVILDELTTGLDPQARRDAWDAVEQARASGVTVVLVTHLMDEAEQLCDRIAVVDAGRVVALDSPAGLVAALPDGQRLRFHPSDPVPEGMFAALPQVHTVERAGEQLVVTGSGDLLGAVTSALAAHRIVPVGLRMDQAGLDAVFVHLTGGRDVAA